MQLRFVLLSVGVAIALFVVLVVFMELGRRLGQTTAKRNGDKGPSNAGIVDNSVYGLLALLIGFTFSGAAGRFDHRRELVGEEANSATTAWIRIDILPEAQRPAIKDGLRRYVDAVLAWYQSRDSSAPFDQPETVTQAQDELWRRAVAACLAPGGEAARMLLLPELNDLFDGVDRERMARAIHPPKVIWLMLAITALAAALFAGYGFSGSSRNWLYIAGFAASVSISTYVIIELEFPRLGFTSLANVDRPMGDARTSLK